MTIATGGSAVARSPFWLKKAVAAALSTPRLDGCWSRCSLSIRGLRPCTGAGADGANSGHTVAIPDFRSCVGR